MTFLTTYALWILIFSSSGSPNFNSSGSGLGNCPYSLGVSNCAHKRTVYTRLFEIVCFVTEECVKNIMHMRN
jgi:hypothetical protein